MGSAFTAYAVQVALAALLGGSGTYGILKYLNERRKLKIDAEHGDADTARILNSSAIGLLAPAREQVAFLRSELNSANSEILDYRARINSAEQEIMKLSHHVQELTDQVRILVAENEKLRGLIDARKQEEEDRHE